MKKIVYLLLFCFLTANVYAQAGWSADRRLTYFYGYSYDPKAACNGDTIHLVWWEGYVDTMIHEEVFYKRSTDCGLTWGDSVQLSVEDAVTSTMPKIAVSGNDVHVVWFEQSYGLFYRQSTDGGSTWQNIDNLIPQLGYSSIQAFGDTVYVCGAGGSTASLMFTKSTDGGNNWTPVTTITPANDSPNLRIISNNILYLVISYVGFPNIEVYSVHSYDGGETWSDSQMVSEFSIASQRPAMDTDDSGGVHISWYDYKYSPYAWTGDIFYRTSRDSGNTWEEIDSLTVMHRAVASDILAESNNLHLVWEDDRYDFNHNFEIFYRMSTDLGQNWDSEVRLTDTLNWSRMPSLACNGRYLHLFWFDLRDDTTNRWGEIYYKRKDLVVPISEENKTTLTSKSKVDIYPNPFSSTLNIRMRFSGENSEIKIFDILGKEIKAYGVKDKTGGIRLDTRNLPSGLYFVTIKAGDATVIKKVVKIR